MFSLSSALLMLRPVVTRPPGASAQIHTAGNSSVDVGGDWSRRPGGGAAAGGTHLLPVQEGQEEEGEPIEDPRTATPWI